MLNKTCMQKEMMFLQFGVPKLTLTWEFCDRGIPASRRPLGAVSLEEIRLDCVHPDCEGASIKYRSKLREKIEELKQAGLTKGSFAIQCQGKKRGSSGSLTCGGFYSFEVEIELDAPANNPPTVTPSGIK